MAYEPYEADGRCVTWAKRALDLAQDAHAFAKKGEDSSANAHSAVAQVYATLANSPHLDKMHGGAD